MGYLPYLENILESIGKVFCLVGYLCTGVLVNQDLLVEHNDMYLVCIGGLECKLIHVDYDEDKLIIKLWLMRL